MKITVSAQQQVVVMASYNTMKNEATLNIARQHDCTRTQVRPGKGRQHHLVTAMDYKGIHAVAFYLESNTTPLGNEACHFREQYIVGQCVTNRTGSVHNRRCLLGFLGSDVRDWVLHMSVYC